MADVSDVETALANAAAVALYPNGPSGPSVPGPDCRIYRGWPISGALDADLSIGTINVTVFPAARVGRTTTRYSTRWSGTPVPPPLYATVAGTTVTFAGAAAAGQVAGILADGQSYAYRIRSGDTPELVAANLASLMRARRVVNLSGATVVVAGAARVQGRVVADAWMQQEVRRQEQDFHVTWWCPTPALRDATSMAIYQSLSTTCFITLGDGTAGKLVYAGTTLFDQSQNARLYRRDLTYCVEYATVSTLSRPTMIFGNLVLNTESNFV
jgi:hypothetical protein